MRRVAVVALVAVLLAWLVLPPVEGARKLFAAAGEPKQLWIAPRGGHVDAINVFPDEYPARVLAFLRDALRDRGL